MIKFLVLVVVILLLGWFGWGWYVNKGIKRPPSTTVNEFNGGIVQKSVGPMITASVMLDGAHSSNMNKGFSILANYIFGGNTQRDSIAMTAPVTSKRTNESIAMTAPVTSTVQGENEIISFIMPEGYTLDTLPLANDDRIVFEEQEEKQYYVRPFDGYAGQSRSEQQRQLFIKALEREGLTYEDDFTLAQYNDPWTPPMMRLNEWWTPVAQ